MNGPAELNPMNIHEAIEVMKILDPYLAEMRDQPNARMVLLSLIRQARQNSPADTLRLIAYMHHIPIDKVAERLADADGRKLIRALGEGFAVNSIADLANAGKLLGLTETEWLPTKEADA